MRAFILLLAVAFVAALLAGIAGRIGAEGRALLAGMVYGALASVPASILAYLLTRDGQSTPAQPRRAGYQPVVIMGSPPPQRVQPLPDYPPLSSQGQQPAPRFRVVGE